MKRYDTYKDSGVLWIGEIPSHWQVCKIKHHYLMTAGFTPDTRRLDYYDEDGYVWVTIADLQGKVIEDSAKKVSKKYIQEKEPTLVKKGSLLYSFKLSVGQVTFANCDLYTNEAIASFIKTNKVCLPYLYYSAPIFIIRNANENIYGAKLLNQDLINNATTLFPPLAEQEAIAAWLDVKCGEIDKLIATQQRRIELLQELRQSIITRAVTHGINPDAPMRPSGIDWIGNIPKHWESKRLRFVCELRNGYTPSKANPDFWTDGTIPWYRMEDIRESGRRLNEAKQYITEEAVKGGGLFEAGSFILATTATIGEHAVLIVDSLANQRFTNLKIRKSLTQSVMTDYFFYYLFVIDEYCKTTTRTATFPAVNMEDLKNFLIVYPSPAEQQEIVNYIERETAKVDSAIGKAERQIALLQELRQSVITEVVTGKRKVC